MKVRLKTDAGRLPLFVTIGFSVALHGLFITGLPNMPWVSRPAEIFRLTRYVVRFAKPVAVPRPAATEVAAVEATSVEAAPIQPLADLQTGEPVERVEMPPVDPVQPLTAPAPALPKPPEIRQPSAAPERPRTEPQRDAGVEPQQYRRRCSRSRQWRRSCGSAPPHLCGSGLTFSPSTPTGNRRRHR